jgi:hypothetical protein
MITIQKAVPMPPIPIYVPDKYPWKRMKIGDSFFASGMNAKQMSSAASYTRKKHGMTFSVRSVVENKAAGTRVWRVT